MIKISSVFELQDARYCAAAGAGFVGFSLKTGEAHSLSPQKIREITAWLAGTHFVIEYDRESVSLMEEIHQTMPYYGVEISQADWGNLPFLPELPVFLVLNPDTPVERAREWIQSLIAHHPDSRLIIPVNNAPEFLQEWVSLKEYSFLQFPSLPEAIRYIQQPEAVTFYGISTGKEAFLPSGEGLDYENLDILFETYQHIVHS